MNYRVLFLFIVAMMTSPALLAETIELAALKAQLESLIERVAKLEAENRSLTSVKEETGKKPNPTRVTKNTSSWADSITIKGDLRYRYEMIEKEGSSTRERNRVRARVALAANATDNVKVGIGIASGSTDPVSTNQSLGGGSSTKDLRLDLAYLDWQISPSTHLIAGKMKNTFYKPGKNSLMWDGDLRPEGLSVTYKSKNWFTNTGLMWLESDTKKSNHRFGYGLQTGYAGKTDRVKFKIGAGFYNFGTEGRTVFYGDADDFFGNSYSCADYDTLSGCTYDNDYAEMEFFADMSTSIGDYPFSTFIHYVTNSDANDNDAAWATGFKLGKAGSSGRWDLGYVYQDIEADAILGLFTDSDFAGGGTDGKGHILKLGLALTKNWSMKLTYFNTEQQPDRASEKDYERIQIDTVLKF